MRETTRRTSISVSFPTKESVCIKVVGRLVLGLDSAERFRGVVGNALRLKGPRFLLIDLEGLVQIDCAGLRELEAAHHSTCMVGADLFIFNRPKFLTKLLTMFRLDDQTLCGAGGDRRRTTREKLERACSDAQEYFEALTYVPCHDKVNYVGLFRVVFLKLYGPSGVFANKELGDRFYEAYSTQVETGAVADLVDMRHALAQSQHFTPREKEEILKAFLGFTA